VDFKRFETDLITGAFSFTIALGADRVASPDILAVFGRKVFSPISPGFLMRISN
jgi:hypothetical protein